jgi:hypothetical protein
MLDVRSLLQNVVQSVKETIKKSEQASKQLVTLQVTDQAIGLDLTELGQKVDLGNKEVKKDVHNQTATLLSNTFLTAFDNLSKHGYTLNCYVNKRSDGNISLKHGSTIKATAHGFIDTSNTTKFGRYLKFNVIYSKGNSTTWNKAKELEHGVYSKGNDNREYISFDFSTDLQTCFDILLKLDLIKPIEKAIDIAKES